MADAQPQVQLDDEAKALLLAQTKAEARQAIAKANAATATAGLYQAESKPVAGETTVASTSASLLNVAGLRGLRSAAQRIAVDVHAALGDHACVLLVSSLDFAAADAPAVEIAGRLKAFTDRFGEAEKTLSPPAPEPEQPPRQAMMSLAPAVIAAAPAGAAAMSLVGLAADLVGMFKTNYSVTGQDVTFGSDALAAVVAHELMAKNINVCIDGFRSLEGSPTIQRFTQLVDRRRALEDLVLRTEAVEVAPTQAQIDALGKQIDAAKTPGDLQALLAQRSALQTPDFLHRAAEIAASRALIAAFDQYATAVTDVPQGQQYSPLVAAALRDVVHEGIKVGDDEWRATHILYLAAVAGGDEVTRTGLFQHNERVGLIGACQVTYTLIDERGPIRAADSLGRYTSATLDVRDGTVVWQDE